MNWAELRDLIEALPEDSATKAALAGDVDGRRWTQDTYIGASTYNALLLLIRVMWAAHLKGQPPPMDTVDPPRRQEDLEAEQEAAAATARSEAILNSFSPGATPVDDTEIQHWHQKIHELEAQQ
ncbi:hypothetical protein [Streptomyces sp. NPDC088258]|uniref:hypothetical protein n=1 Tax=Streptomyces sp. NPDC088258 TaxID=3365849 RepID=UPI00380B47C8